MAAPAAGENYGQIQLVAVGRKFMYNGYQGKWLDWKVASFSFTAHDLTIVF